MSDNLKLCFKCRKLKGFKGRDNGAHTAMRAKCECCGNVESILPSRHWVKEVNDELTEFEKFTLCTKIRKSKGRVKIDCKLGLWNVDTPTMEQSVDEAKHYFLQYLDDGEYSQIIGGKSVVETLIDKGVNYE